MQPPSRARAALSAAFVLLVTAACAYLLLSGSGERVERVALWVVTVSGAAFLGLLAIAFFAAARSSRRPS